MVERTSCATSLGMATIRMDCILISLLSGTGAVTATARTIVRKWWYAILSATRGQTPLLVQWRLWSNLGGGLRRVHLRTRWTGVRSNLTRSGHLVAIDYG